VNAYRKDKNVAEWSAEKIAKYNEHLSGKILIPQPFGRLRNLHEAETSLIDQNTAWINWHDPGLCISKFMLIELAVGLIVCLLFAWLAKKLSAGGPPRGILWNLLETFYLFIRDKIARPAIGGDHEEHDDGHAHGEHDAHGHEGHGHAAPVHAHVHEDQAEKVTPLLMTFFFFILGCNLMGMLPWAGSPTSSFGVTLALAMMTFATVVVLGMNKFGFVGFFLNQIPGMNLPWYMAIIIKPMLFAIELMGLLIKHGVLAVRLLANMVAGHLVILGIMGIAFGAEAALALSTPENSWQWWVAAPIAVVASTAFNLLELLVAFLQAYVFTFLSALFIGAALHKH
jgi:F-type H+-transporting ATPase subunit a